MHRCLNITEILYLIFEQVRLEEPSSCQRPLCRLALTCRAFKEPALDNLYCDIDLWSFLSCLGRDAVKAPRWASYTMNSVIYNARGLRESDAAVIRKYNWRIRSLWFCRVGYRILDDLQKLFPDGTLLPNLKELLFCGGSYRYLPTFMNPGLASLDINLDALDEHSAAQLNSLPSKFSLSSTSSGPCNLSIEFGCIDFRYPCRPTPLDRWYGLRELDLQHAVPESFFYVSHLPHLRVFAIKKFSESYNVDHERFASNLLPFPELRHLEIQDIALNVSHQLLPLLRCSKITSLTMLQDLNVPSNEFSIVSREEDFTSFVEGVGRHCNPAYLRTLHFTTRTPISLGVGFSTLVAPLQQFSLLKSFKMRTRMCPWVSSQDATWIGENWPNIRTLCINPSDYIERFRRPRSKLSVLSSLAHACCELRHLELEIDAENSCERSELFKSLALPDGSSQTNAPTLKELHVRYSPIKNRDKKLVAAYLNLVFPNLETLTARSHSYTIADFRNRWNRIANNLLPEIRREIEEIDMDGVSDVEGELCHRRYQYMEDVEVMSDAEEDDSQDKRLILSLCDYDLSE